MFWEKALPIYVVANGHGRWVYAYQLIKVETLERATRTYISSHQLHAYTELCLVPKKKMMEGQVNVLVREHYKEIQISGGENNWDSFDKWQELTNMIEDVDTSMEHVQFKENGREKSAIFLVEAFQNNKGEWEDRAVLCTDDVMDKIREEYETKTKHWEPIEWDLIYDLVIKGKIPSQILVKRG